MSSSILVNNFSSGILSKKARRLVDAQLYNNSATLMNNVVPVVTGGFRIRPSVKLITNVGIEYVRIIPFVISENEYYLLAFKPKILNILSFSAASSIIKNDNNFFTTEYENREDILALKYAQDFERIILVNKNHTPFVITKTDLGFSAKNIELETKTSKYSKDANGNKTYNVYNYEGLFTSKGQYPSCVTFCSNRLWFASSVNNPFRLWASRPFEWNNFQEVDYYETLDSTTTVDDYLEAISGETQKVQYFIDEAGTEEVNDEKLANYKIITAKSADLTTGFTMITKTIYKKTKSVSTEQIVWTYLSTKTETKSFDDAKTIWKEVITSECSMHLDVGSSNNDTICWINTNENIYVGTSSSEYYMSKDINAQNCSIQKISSYGSELSTEVESGNSSIFYVQTGGKSVRSLSYSAYEGTKNSDITFLCSDIFVSKIKEIYWQRVPEQRMYCVMNDGTLNVLINDGGNISAWAIWQLNTSLKIISMAVLDTENGQDAYVLLDNGDLCLLDKSDFKDITSEGVGEIKCAVVSNYIDSSSTINLKKKVVKYWVDSMGTSFKICQEGKTPSAPRIIDNTLTMCSNYTTPTESFSFRIENNGISNFIILALVLELEVS